MSQTAPIDCQIWFPGPDGWELWLIENGGVGMIKRRSVGQELEFEPSAKSLRVLALPATHTVAFPFVSNALDGEDLAQTARMYVERQGSGFDAAGVMLEPVFGEPPGTVVRVDAPLVKRNQECGCNLVPHIVVPAATLLPLPAKSVAVWRELGNFVAAFERDGKTMFYDLLTEKGPSVMAELDRIEFQLMSDGLIASPERLVVWSAELDSCFAGGYSKLVIPTERPAPRLLHTGNTLRPQWYRAEAERVADSKKRKRRKWFVSTGVGFAVVLLLISLMVNQFRVKEMEREIDKLAPVVERVKAMKSKWSEVATGVDPDASCLEVWMNVFSLPGIGVVQIDRFGISRDKIEITGTAKSASHALQFIDEIMTKQDLSGYQWVNQPPGIKKDGSAKFEIQGIR
ncbi:MAG: hypothetical protein P1V20_28300 [Verrucomicrobiales bacterium]|nr:hypothetical protein [Verrucomicrobiales bacterium]